MSFLVEIDESAYRSNAINSFSASPSFALGDAQTMMWMSQLAYETAHPDKIKTILGRWSLGFKDLAGNDPTNRLPPNSACFVAAAGRNATIIAFSGTDPLNIIDWITDFTVVHSTDDLHTGFKAALDAVWASRIRPVIEQRVANEQSLYFTGHSLGGALAILAAERAMSELSVTATAVYTFGSPRTGGTDFFARYGTELADRTFRLVYANDIVPAVPLTIRGNFLHVGHCMRCASADHFSANTPRELISQNNPDILANVLNSALAAIFLFKLGHPAPGAGSRLIDQLSIALPPPIRDHLPANYFRALSIPLK